MKKLSVFLMAFFVLLCQLTNEVHGARSVKHRIGHSHRGSRIRATIPVQSQTITLKENSEIIEKLQDMGISESFSQYLLAHYKEYQEKLMQTITIGENSYNICWPWSTNETTKTIELLTYVYYSTEHPQEAIVEPFRAACIDSMPENFSEYFTIIAQSTIGHELLSVMTALWLINSYLPIKLDFKEDENSIGSSKEKTTSFVFEKHCSPENKNFIFHFQILPLDVLLFQTLVSRIYDKDRGINITQQQNNQDIMQQKACVAKIKKINRYPRNSDALITTAFETIFPKISSFRAITGFSIGENLNAFNQNFYTWSKYEYIRLTSLVFPYNQLHNADTFKITASINCCFNTSFFNFYQEGKTNEFLQKLSHFFVEQREQFKIIKKLQATGIPESLIVDLIGDAEKFLRELEVSK